MNKQAWWEVVVPYKGRELVFGDKVQVYRNLHKTDGGMYGSPSKEAAWL